MHLSGALGCGRRLRSGAVGQLEHPQFQRVNPEALSGGAWQPDPVSHLTVETVGHVRVLRLDRPERKNALTSSVGWSIVRAIGDAHADDNVRVVALTGNGDAFCSGLDLAGGAMTGRATAAWTRLLPVGRDREDGVRRSEGR